MSPNPKQFLYLSLILNHKNFSLPKIYPPPVPIRLRRVNPEPVVHENKIETFLEFPIQNLLYASKHVENKKNIGAYVQSVCHISLLFFYSLNGLKINKYVVIHRKI